MVDAGSLVRDAQPVLRLVSILHKVDLRCLLDIGMADSRGERLIFVASMAGR